MSNIHVRQPHTLSRDAAKAKLASFQELLGKYRVSLTWKGDEATISGMGVSGGAKVTDSAVDIEVKLGMLARAAGVDASKLEGTISRKLKAAFEA